MPRPKKCRFVDEYPQSGYFKPQGIPLTDLEEIQLPVEGYEAIRLADLEKMEHEDAAEKMGISRPTFSRILSSAREIIAKALTKSLAIRIDGGEYRIRTEDEFCRGMGRGQGRGMGRGRACGRGLGRGQGLGRGRGLGMGPGQGRGLGTVINEDEK